MSSTQPYVFVLWGNQFDEIAATVFVTEMRRVGLRVKIVGLNHRKLSGSHGLILMPDFTLEQALPLAGSTVCLVIPCSSPVIRRLKNDPRLPGFFSKVSSRGAEFVTGQFDRADKTDLNSLAIPEQVTVYPPSEDLVVFARQLATSLFASSKPEPFTAN